MWIRKRVVTVHPVGGAPMGRDPSPGVCDPYGEVFGYPGLYVADGAAMPGPVGPNPALTIAALADRMCTWLLDKAPATRGGERTWSCAGAAADPGQPTRPSRPPGPHLTVVQRGDEGIYFPGASNRGARRRPGICRSRSPSGSPSPPTT